MLAPVRAEGPSSSGGGWAVRPPLAPAWEGVAPKEGDRHLHEERWGGRAGQGRQRTGRQVAAWQGEKARGVGLGEGRGRGRRGVVSQDGEGQDQAGRGGEDRVVVRVKTGGGQGRGGERCGDCRWGQMQRDHPPTQASLSQWWVGR